MPILKGQVLGTLQERLERRSWRGGRWRRLQSREGEFPGFQGADSERPTYRGLKFLQSLYGGAGGQLECSSFLALQDLPRERQGGIFLA